MSNMQFLYAPLGPNSKAVFTTNLGGVSLGSYAGKDDGGLNLGKHVGDDSEKVELNRRQVADFFEVEFAFMDQTHTDIVQICEDEYSLCNADSIVVIHKNRMSERVLVPTVMVADCVPVLLSNRKGDISAAVHVGRQGMVNQILPKTLNKLFEMGIKSEELYAAIGPSICGNCYEVDEKVYVDCVSVEPNSAWLTPQKTDAINVYNAVLDQLSRNNIVNIETVDVCTFEDDRFYSYRRSKVCGRQIGFVLPMNNEE
ncbi:peptidoglycan editing factor PgeF [Actinomyces sp. zg-332]|uniref:peptidoglycan editing factor PgeF n=1 Tax=Actinomyces sp. zg-332 TaxID=2708340 RepID=UPI00142118B5|nr:peptidoglycan editing factor PgeF [Actinomyces sp. zg-332]QPK94431.1 peptidoglycan editing factor PgeF [Actinomyces sp. zg-332]